MRIETTAAFKLATVLALAVQLSCASGQGDAARQPEVTNGPFYLPADEFSYTKVTVDQAEVPARFAASPATSLEQLDDRVNYPPIEQFSHWLCTGEHQAREKWLESLRQAASRGELPKELRFHYERLGSTYCVDDGWCKRLDQELEAAPSAPVLQVLHEAKSDCGGFGFDIGSSDVRMPIEQSVRDWRFDALTYLEAHANHRSNVVTALRKCVRNGELDGFTRQDCLANLAQLDRSQSVALARQLLAERSLQRLGDTPGVLARTLARFPKPAEFEESLRTLGLIDTGHAPKHPDLARRALMARDYLRAWGRMTMFELETGTFPNHHDLLLDELAGLTGGELDDVFFEEIPPRLDMQTGKSRGEYVLHAYMDEKRYTVEVENHGDWLDFDKSLAFINTLLHQKQSDVRCVVLGVAWDRPHVACATAEALLEARDAGLLSFKVVCRAPECQSASSVREAIRQKEWEKRHE